nr:MAG TPA: hypothetical protein [Caudoviricetes sp.]
MHCCLRFEIDCPSALPVSIRVRHVFPFQKKHHISGGFCVIYSLIKLNSASSPSSNITSTSILQFLYPSFVAVQLQYFLILSSDQLPFKSTHSFLKSFILGIYLHSAEARDGNNTSARIDVTAILISLPLITRGAVCAIALYPCVHITAVFAVFQQLHLKYHVKLCKQ